MSDLDVTRIQQSREGLWYLKLAKWQWVHLLWRLKLRDQRDVTEAHRIYQQHDGPKDYLPPWRWSQLPPVHPSSNREDLLRSLLVQREYLEQYAQWKPIIRACNWFMVAFTVVFLSVLPAMLLLLPIVVLGCLVVLISIGQTLFFVLNEKAVGIWFDGDAIEIPLSLGVLCFVVGALTSLFYIVPAIFVNVVYGLAGAFLFIALVVMCFGLLESKPPRCSAWSQVVGFGVANTFVLFVIKLSLYIFTQPTLSEELRDNATFNEMVQHHQIYQPAIFETPGFWASNEVYSIWSETRSKTETIWFAHFEYRREAERILEDLNIDHEKYAVQLLNHFWDEPRLKALQQVQATHYANQMLVKDLVDDLLLNGVDLRLPSVPYTNGLVQYLSALQVDAKIHESWVREGEQYEIKNEVFVIELTGEMHFDQEENGPETLQVQIQSSKWRNDWAAHHYRILMNQECVFIRENSQFNIEWTDELWQSCLVGFTDLERCQDINTEMLTGEISVTNDPADWWTRIDNPVVKQIPYPQDILTRSVLTIDDSSTFVSPFQWILTNDFVETLPKPLQQHFDDAGLAPPPTCIRDGFEIGYHQELLLELASVFQNIDEGKRLRKRYQAINGDPDTDVTKWYGSHRKIGNDTQSLFFPYPTLTRDDIQRLTSEIEQHEQEYALMEALRKRATTVHIDTTKWQPPYDVESCTKQVELAVKLVEEMKGLMQKSNTLHVDLTQTTINDVPVLQRPYQESVVKQLGAELTRIEGFIDAWNTARTEAFKVGYTFPRTLPADKMTQKVLNWHTQYISQTPTVRKLMQQFKMVTIPKGEFLYLDFTEPFVVDHSFKMGSTELTEEIYCTVLGLEENDDRKCRKNYPVSVLWPSAKDFMMVLSFQMGTGCDATFERCGKSYRMPTLTEWRYAASAKQHYYYAGAHNPYDVAWIDEGVMPVGMKEPNAWGLYDMSGNHKEWVDTLNPKDDEGYRYQGAGEKSIRDLSNKYNRNQSYNGYNYCGIRLVYDTQSTETISWHQEPSEE